MVKSDWTFDINVFEDYVSITAKNKVTHNTIYGKNTYNVSWYERMRGITMMCKMCKTIDQILEEINLFDNNFSDAEALIYHYKDVNIVVH